MPLPRQFLEGLRRLLTSGNLQVDLVLAWINPVTQQLSSSAPLFPGFSQTDRWIRTQRQRSALRCKPVIHTPIAATAGIDKQIEPVTVGELVRVGSGFC